MQRLREALEALDQIISELEDKIEGEATVRVVEMKKQNEALKVARSREATTFAIAQKVAARMDHAIGRVERVLRD